MTSTSPLRGSSRPVAPAEPVTCVQGSQRTAQDTLNTLRAGVRERSFACVLKCMHPKQQAQLANIVDPAVQKAVLDQARGYVERITNQVRSETSTEVTFKMKSKGTPEFAKFVLVGKTWYMD